MGKDLFMRKAQLEMIGLIVIVIIVITGLLVFTVYKMSSSPKNIQEAYVNKALATNLLISMTRTNIRECHNSSLAILITDCARFRHDITCYDYTSCEIANKTVFDILNKTLVAWNVRFNLSITSARGTFINFVNLKCDSRAKESEQSFESLPLGGGQTAEITLDICTK